MEIDAISFDSIVILVLFVLEYFNLIFWDFRGSEFRKKKFLFFFSC